MAILAEIIAMHIEDGRERGRERGREDGHERNPLITHRQILIYSSILEPRIG